MGKTSDTRIGIIGAGALGGLFGAYLHESGYDVHLVDKNPEIVDRITSDGLRVERPDEEDLVVQPPITTAPAAIGPVDVVFVFVKAIHTEAAVRDATPMFDDNTLAVTVQNGLKNREIISDQVPQHRVVAGTTTVGSSLEDPGHVLHTGWGETKLGCGDDETAARVASLLQDAGFDATVVDNPQAHIWEKQLLSVAIKPTAALTELTDGPLAEHDETWSVMERLVEEATAVAEARNVELTTDDHLDALREVCAANYDTVSSMLEDVRKERRTEIEHINGAIVEYADEVGLAVPYNRMATNLVKGKEHSYAD